MDTFKLVLPGHLNHYGYLFGGTLLKWVDEASWIAASLDFPGYKFVTIGMDKVEFRKSVKQGSILRFSAAKSKVGTTSVQYSVNVFNKNIETGVEENAFSTRITFVRLDEEGKKAPIEPEGARLPNP